MTLTPAKPPKISGDGLTPARSSLVWYTGVLAFAILLVGLISIPVYFIPKATGDAFVEGIRIFDPFEVEIRLCDGLRLIDIGRTLSRDGSDEVRSLGQALSGGSVSGFAQAASAGALRVDSSYDVFSSAYTFRFTVVESDFEFLESMVGQRTPQVTVNIRRDIRKMSACIEAG